MDHPAHRHPTIVLRLSVTVRWPVGAIVRRSTVALVRRLRVPAVPWPSAVTLRRLAADAARRFAIAGILALAIVLVAVVPVRAAQLAMESDLWNLAGYFDGGASPQAASSSVLAGRAAQARS
jgi:hypothetical protein